MAPAPDPSPIAEQAKQQQQQEAVGALEAQPEEPALDVDDNAELDMDQVKQCSRIICLVHI